MGKIGKLMKNDSWPRGMNFSITTSAHRHGGCYKKIYYHLRTKGMPPHAFLGAVPGGNDNCDLYQVGRMNAPNNDLTLRGPLYRTNEGRNRLIYWRFCILFHVKKENFSYIIVVGHWKGPVSRFSLRIACSRTSGQCYLFAGGFDQREVCQNDLLMYSSLKFGLWSGIWCANGRKQYRNRASSTTTINQFMLLLSGYRSVDNSYIKRRNWFKWGN